MWTNVDDDLHEVLSLVDYLVEFKDTNITVASNLIKEAEGIAARHPQFIKAALVDIFNVSFR